jgi:hypothetical protein
MMTAALIKALTFGPVLGFFYSCMDWWDDRKPWWVQNMFMGFVVYGVAFSVNVFLPGADIVICIGLSFLACRTISNRD